VRREEDREAKDFSEPNSGWVTKGTVNLIKVGMMSCKSRTVLTVCRDRWEASWTGYHRCHGEACVSTGTRVELSVGSLCMDKGPLVRQRMMQRELDCLVSISLARPIYTAASPARPMSRRSVLPGIELSTYHIGGSPREHGNLKLSAGAETVSKPTSPATSQLRGRVFVVVRARESRVQGEGRQSMSMAAGPLG
jgi:hypothetical protein